MELKDLEVELKRIFPSHSFSSPLDDRELRGLGHGYRAVLLSYLHALNPEVSDDALSAIASWRDVEEWVLRDSDRAGTATFSRAEARSARVRLRPIRSSDIESLYLSALSPHSSHQWRFRGRTPDLAEFNLALYSGVLTQFIVESCSCPPESLGLVVAYNADLSQGWCYFAVQRLVEREHRLRGAMSEGAMVFFQFLFDTFPLRKIYMEVPSYNRHLVDALVSSGIASQEGNLRKHQFVVDGYVDVAIISLERAVWRGRTAHWFEAGPSGLAGAEAAAPPE